MNTAADIALAVSRRARLVVMTLLTAGLLKLAAAAPEPFLAPDPISTGSGDGSAPID